MAFFSEHADALLHDWFASPTWHIDKPSENAKFYCFAAVLMLDLGQPDIREVRCALKEAGSHWASDFAAHNGEQRVAVLCERLQVLYDFFGAIAGTEAATLPAKSTSHKAQTCSSTTPSLPILQQDASAAPVVAVEALETSGQALGTSVSQNESKPPASRIARPKKQTQNETQQNEIEQNDNLPSGERWRQFCVGVIRLHALLLERRGQPPSVPIPLCQSEAIAAEMKRWTDKVLHAEEITGAEKRDLIGTIIDKVMPDIEGSTVTIKWLK